MARWRETRRAAPLEPTGSRAGVRSAACARAGYVSQEGGGEDPPGVERAERPGTGGLGGPGGGPAHRMKGGATMTLADIAAYWILQLSRGGAQRPFEFPIRLPTLAK